MVPEAPLEKLEGMKSFPAHLTNLRLVFDRLKEAGLKLKPRKCRLCLHKVNFLGHIVSADGIQTDTQKTESLYGLHLHRRRRFSSSLGWQATISGL